MKDVYAVVLENQSFDFNKIMFIPKKLIKLKDTDKLIGKHGKKYHSIKEEEKSNYIFFFIEKEGLEQIYCILVNDVKQNFNKN